MSGDPKARIQGFPSPVIPKIMPNFKHSNSFRWINLRLNFSKLVSEKNSCPRAAFWFVPHFSSWLRGSFDPCQTTYWTICSCRRPHRQQRAVLSSVRCRRTARVAGWVRCGVCGRAPGRWRQPSSAPVATARPLSSAAVPRARHETWPSSARPPWKPASAAAHRHSSV